MNDVLLEMNQESQKADQEVGQAQNEQQSDQVDDGLAYFDFFDFNRAFQKLRHHDPAKHAELHRGIIAALLPDVHSTASEEDEMSLMEEQPKNPCESKIKKAVKKAKAEAKRKMD